MGEPTSPADILRDYVMKKRPVPGRVMREHGVDREVLERALDAVWWATGPHMRGYETLKPHFNAGLRGPIVDVLIREHGAGPEAEDILGAPRWLCLLDGRIAAREQQKYGNVSDETIARLGLPARTKRLGYDETWTISRHGYARIFLGRDRDWFVASNFGKVPSVLRTRDTAEMLAYYAALLPPEFTSLAPSEANPRGIVYEPESVPLYLARGLMRTLAASQKEKARVLEKDALALEGLEEALAPYEVPRF